MIFLYAKGKGVSGFKFCHGKFFKIRLDSDF
jgi:hypothetical protein